MEKLDIKKLDGIDNLIIDFGVVICDLDIFACVKPFESMGFANVRECLSSHSQKGVFGDADSGKKCAKEFCEEIRNICKNKNLSDKEIISAWTSVILDVPRYKLDLLFELKKHYRMFLLSNINDMIWEHVKDAHFSYKNRTPEDYFEKFYLSYQLHISKPDPKIMEHVLSDSGIDPKRSMLIDDALANCKMAETFGLKTYAPKPQEDWSHLFA